MQLQLRHRWTFGSQIGGGGFGQVFVARLNLKVWVPPVAKLVPKAPGALRELLFADLDGVRNIVPVIDSGETDDHWVLVMPRAEMSLRQQLVAVGGKLDVSRRHCSRSEGYLHRAFRHGWQGGASRPEAGERPSPQRKHGVSRTSGASAVRRGNDGSGHTKVRHDGALLGPRSAGAPNGLPARPTYMPWA